MKSFELELANDKLHPKRLFAYINSKKTCKPQLNCLRSSTGEQITDMGMVANIMNQQFASVFKREDTSNMPSFEFRTNALLDAPVISAKDIELKLSMLNTSRSPGNDSVHAVVLRHTSAAVSVPLAIIFNKSLSTGKFPAVWKSANVTPIHKKGDRMDPGNYRPISLLSIISKVLEWFVRSAIVNHLTRNQLFSPSQHGFVPHSTSHVQPT